MKELKAIGASYGRSAIAGMLAVYMTFQMMAQV